MKLSFIEIVAIICLMLIFMVVVYPANANEVGATVGSYHFDRTQNYNERNYGLYAAHGNLFGTVYKNSYNDWAGMIAGRSIFHVVPNRVDVGLLYGLVFGYGINNWKLDDADKYKKGIIPMVTPYVSVRWQRAIKLNMFFIPDGLAFSAGFEF